MPVLRFILRFSFIPLVIFSIIFCLNNRELIVVDFWPFAGLLKVPLFALILGAIVIGLILNSITNWVTNKDRDQTRTIPSITNNTLAKVSKFSKLTTNVTKKGV